MVKKKRYKLLKFIFYLYSKKNQEDFQYWISLCNLFLGKQYICLIYGLIDIYKNNEFIKHLSPVEY